VLCQKIEGWAGTPLHTLFDLIAGTSTGGIIAMGLTIPPGGKPAADLVNFYKTDGVKIFARPRGPLRYLQGSKYNPSTLERIVTEYFGSAMISQAVVEVLVTSYDIRHRTPVYISRRKARQDRSDDYLMREVARGTSAAPTYFPPAIVKDRVLIDGGVVANNPACMAYAEAKQLWPGEEIFLVSLGTGTLTRTIPLTQARKWGAFLWAQPFIDCLFDGTARATEDFLRCTMPLDHYRRYQGHLSEHTETLDSVSEAGILGLQRIGEDIARNAEQDIFRLIEILKQAGKTLRARIGRPRGEDIVAPGDCPVEGSVQDYAGELLYLFTGVEGRYWPSARVIPRDNRWQGRVNVGNRGPTGTITLAAVDQRLADYIEFYRAHAESLRHPGMTIQDFPQQLDQVRVIINLKA
jgi:predicted acylesterase/phospholipase RssA